jgi:hypothetical protein
MNRLTFDATRTARRLAGTSGALALSAVLCGCMATTSPQWDLVAGDATRGLMAQQVIDVDAARRGALRPESAEGRTSRQAVDRMVDSYRVPTATGAEAGGAAANAR